MKDVTNTIFHALEGTRGETTATGALAWLLNNTEDYGLAAFRKLLNDETIQLSLDDPEAAERQWKAEFVPKSNDSRFDLLLEYSAFTLLIEAKMNSLATIEQLDRYANHLRGPDLGTGKKFLILLTNNISDDQRPTNLSDIKFLQISWETLLTTLKATSKPQNGVALSHLCGELLAFIDNRSELLKKELRKSFRSYCAFRPSAARPTLNAPPPAGRALQRGCARPLPGARKRRGQQGHKGLHRIRRTVLWHSRKRTTRLDRVHQESI